MDCPRAKVGASARKPFTLGSESAYGTRTQQDMGDGMHRSSRGGAGRTGALALIGALALATGASGTAAADTVGPITFEAPAFAPGTINGQGGWTKTGPYDAAVVSNTTAPASFGAQSLRVSNAVTSGSFGDQLFSPSVVNPAGEATSDRGTHTGGTLQSHFDATVGFSSASPGAAVLGSAVTISPDRGDGARMSFVRLRDLSDGIHVDVADVPSPATTDGHVDFVTHSDVATGLDRAAAHTLRFAMDFNAGPNNDVVKVYVDGKLVFTGASWENYYRNDTEAAGGGNKVPVTDELLFRVSGASNPASAGKGFLFDGVSLATSTPSPCKLISLTVAGIPGLPIALCL